MHHCRYTKDRSVGPKRIEDGSMEWIWLGEDLVIAVQHGWCRSGNMPNHKR